jgi:hypothetical protein
VILGCRDMNDEAPIQRPQDTLRKWTLLRVVFSQTQATTFSKSKRKQVSVFGDDQSVMRGCSDSDGSALPPDAFLCKFLHTLGAKSTCRMRILTAFVGGGRGRNSLHHSKRIVTGTSKGNDFAGVFDSGLARTIVLAITVAVVTALQQITISAKEIDAVVLILIVMSTKAGLSRPQSGGRSSIHLQLMRFQSLATVSQFGALQLSHQLQWGESFLVRRRGHEMEEIAVALMGGITGVASGR